MAAVTARQGDTVQVHYTGRLEDGTVFDSSEAGDPLEFRIGAGQVIPGFERAVDGMSVGERVTACIPPEQAYGPRSSELILRVGRSEFPKGVKPQVGQRFDVHTKDGTNVRVVVTKTHEDLVELDANHPLAGKELTFDLELVNIT